MKIGIDKIGVYVPNLYVDMYDLANARGVDPQKYIAGIGQDQMAVPPITQDVVTLAANAALDILEEQDKKEIDMVILGTESGIDHSKSGAVYIHRLLGLNPNARAFEIKQACYGATAAIQMAKGHIALNPDKKVLVLASDIARYGLSTAGEVTQGAGAIAMLITKDPRIMTLENDNTYFTDDIMDFWRPIWSDVAYVNGKFSNEQYIRFFNQVWDDYKEKTGHTFADFEAICCHQPYTKMGQKALFPALKGEPEEIQDRLQANYKASTLYNRRIGNIYTGSLYLSLLSLIEQQELLEAGSRIGMFSYGSGAVGEFFSGILQEGYRDHLNLYTHVELFSMRKRLKMETYEEIFRESLPTDGTDFHVNTLQDPAMFSLGGIENGERLYMKKTN